MAHTKESTAKIVQKADQLELDMHEFAVKTMQGNPEIAYQQGINMFLLLKIAELEEDTTVLFKTSKSIYND